MLSAVKAIWLWLAVASTGCSDPLKSDVEMFCGAVVGSNWKTFAEVGPYIAKRAKTEELKAILREATGGQLTAAQIGERMRGYMEKTGVKKCKTLNVIAPLRPGDDPAPARTN